MLQTSYLVVGRGHIGLATAVYLSSQGYTVYLFSRRSSIVAKYSFALIRSELTAENV